jgi:hypothetical protein
VYCGDAWAAGRAGLAGILACVCGLHTRDQVETLCWIKTSTAQHRGCAGKNRCQPGRRERCGVHTCLALTSQLLDGSVARHVLRLGAIRCARSAAAVNGDGHLLLRGKRPSSITGTVAGLAPDSIVLRGMRRGEGAVSSLASSASHRLFP